MKTERALPFTWWQSRPYVLLSAIMFMNFACSGISRPLFSLRAQDLGATLLQIGLILTVGRIASTAVQYLWGHQSDRLMRRKPLVVVGMGLTAVTTYAIGLVDNYRPLFLIQGVASLAMAANGVGSLALIGDILEGQRNRGRLMGLHRGIGSLAFGLGALFGGSIADAYGRHVPFLIGGALDTVAFFLSLRLVEAPLPSPTRAAFTAPATRPTGPSAGAGRITWAQVVRIAPFLLIVLAWFLADGSAFSFWPMYMVGKGLSQTVVTRLWGLAAIGETAAMVLAGLLCERWGSRLVMSAGLMGMGLIFVGYTLVSSLPGLVGIQMMRSLAYSSYTAASMLYATAMGLRQQRGRMAGFHATASGLGGISGGAVGGGLAEALGLETMIRTVGGLMVAIGLLGGWKMAEPSQWRRTEAPQAREPDRA